MKSDFKICNVSEKHNVFIWLPMKTASSTLSWIFAHYDFKKVRYESDGSHSIIQNDVTHFGHNTDMPPNSDGMKLICSLRNPYERFFSFFKMHISKDTNKITPENFENFLEKELVTHKSLLYESSSIFEKRKPDYFIRTENMYRDLIEIPFIRESKLNTCGILEEMCEKKINETFDFEHNLFDNQKYKFIINELFSKHFEYGGYKKIN